MTDHNVMAPWKIEGELILNCNCTVFCPCVVSLGKHPPTEGYCQAWAGVRIDRGFAGDEDLSGLNVALLLDIPGWMGRGNWTVAAYIDERASEAAYDRLIEIFSGQGARHHRSLLDPGLQLPRAPSARRSLSRPTGQRRRLVVPKKNPRRGRAPIEGGADKGQKR